MQCWPSHPHTTPTTQKSAPWNPGLKGPRGAAVTREQGHRESRHPVQGRGSGAAATIPVHAFRRTQQSPRIRSSRLPSSKEVTSLSKHINTRTHAGTPIRTEGKRVNSRIMLFESSSSKSSGDIALTNGNRKLRISNNQKTSKVLETQTRLPYTYNLSP